MWSKYTRAEIRRELEANYFACALLMPKEMFETEWEKYQALDEEKRIAKMTHVFKVPLFAVVMRLQMLSPFC